MTIGADDTYTIHELAHAAGMTPRNVRAYRTKGLLPPPIRIGRVSSYRVVHLQRLRDIKELREAGLPLKLITEAAQRGDELGLGSALFLLTATLSPDPRRSGPGTGDDGTEHERIAQNPAISIVLQRLVKYGLSEQAVEGMLAETRHSCQALSVEAGTLLCADLLVTGPDQLPSLLVSDAITLLTMVTQQMLTQLWL